MTTLHDLFMDFLQAENLAVDAMAKNYAPVYFPLAQWLNQLHRNGRRLIGINGAQGSGKSTLCRLLALLLERGFSKSVAVLSLDDFYLTRDQREALAKQIHPLLQTRGVPGTHDVALAIATLDALQTVYLSGCRGLINRVMIAQRKQHGYRYSSRSILFCLKAGVLVPGHKLLSNY